MSLLSMPVKERLECLEELLSCSGKIYAWTYNSSGDLIDTTCPHLILDKVFHYVGCFDAILKHSKDHKTPVMLSIPYGLNWCAALEFSGETLCSVHVFGPTTISDYSVERLERAMQGSNITLKIKSRLSRILHQLPSISTADLLRYAIMLHYCITGDILTNIDISFMDPVQNQEKVEQPPKRNRNKAYMAEQALMRMITEGDLDYKSVFQDATHVSRGVQLADMESLEQVKISQIVFISISTRAAIKGGLSPDEAYSRGDAYIQDILNCRSAADAAHIGHTMYEDFIKLVHKVHKDNGNSKLIQSCCDYIHFHAEEDLSLSEMAKHFGYADYYLSRKFKQETGRSINNYIKAVRVEKAKTLLLLPDLSIQDICDRLHFGSRSFFAETFREFAGLPPAEYRAQHKKV